MSRQLRRLVGLFFSLLLLVGLLPATQGFKALAAASNAPFVLNTNGSIAVGTSAAQSPPAVNQGTLTISGSYNGVDPSTISITINKVSVNQSTGAVSIVQTANPSQAPSTSALSYNQGTFTFSNVQLFPGTNQIVINGKSTTGAQVSSDANNIGYVNYVNSPALLNFHLLDQNSTPFDSTAYLNQQPNDTFNFTLQANNATSVSVMSDAATNNILASQATGTSTFYAYNVPLHYGVNTITVTAQNDTASVVATRTVVYYSNQFPYNVGFTFGSSPNTSTYLFAYDPNGTVIPPIVSDSRFPSAPATGTPFNGQLIVNGSPSTPPTVTMDVYDTSNPSGVSPLVGQAVQLQVDSANSNSSHTIYNTTSSTLFLSGGNSPQTLPTLANGDNYTVTMHVTVGGITYNYPYTFQFLNPTSLYLKSLARQNGSSSSSTTINPNVADNILSLPQTYNIQIGNLPNVSVNSTPAPVVSVDGTALGSAFYNLNPPATGGDTYQLTFQNDPAGNPFPIKQGVHTITLQISTSSGPFTATFQINYANSPLIQITNLANGQIFDPNLSQNLTEVDARFFNIANSTITDNNINHPNHTILTLNGSTVYGYTPTLYSAQSGVWVFNLASAYVLGGVNGTTQIPISLSPGQNTLVLTTVTNGVQVQSKLTLYQMSQSVSVSVLGPLAGGKVQYQKPSVTPGQDPFSQQVAANQWVTSGDFIIFKAQYANIQNFNVQVNGKNILSQDPIIFSGSYTSTDPNWYSFGANNTGKNLLNYGTPSTASNYDGTYARDGYSYVWIDQPADANKSPTVYVGLQLPQTGSLTIQFMANNSATGIQPIVVSRAAQPYTVVRPFSGSGTVNQNFYDVQIQTTSPSTVTINKATANQSTDFFGNLIPNTYDLIVPLKAGANTIPITVATGTQTYKGTVSLYNANQNVIGAEFQGQLGTSGTLSAFNGALSLKFPKNTVFKNENLTGQVDSGKPVLLQNQNILMGIADPATGYLEYQYDTNTNSNLPFNGLNTTVSTQGPVLIQALRNMGYNIVDNLYWVDPGYYYNNQAHDGVQPYLLNNEFYKRTDNLKLFPTNTGTLTLSYDPSLRDAVGTNITVMHYNPSEPGTPWQDLGGVVNTSNHSITVNFSDPGYYVVSYLRHGYNDIINSSWARNYMNTVLAKGIMLPYQPGTQFGASLNITRAEWAEVMVKALGLDLKYDSNNLTFVDIPNQVIPGQLWDYRYIETAARKGIIYGVGDGAFQPNGNVTREDAAVMIARAMNLKVASDAQYTQTSSALSKLYTDSGGIDVYSAGAVLAVSKLGIMNGNPNPTTNGQKPTYYFAPGASMTREEASAIAYRVLQQMGKLPK